MIEKQKEKLNQILEVLHQVEWEGNEKGSRCIVCFEHFSIGHKSGCKLNESILSLKEIIQITE